MWEEKETQKLFFTPLSNGLQMADWPRRAVLVFFFCHLSPSELLSTGQVTPPTCTASKTINRWQPKTNKLGVSILRRKIIHN